MKIGGLNKRMCFYKHIQVYLIGIYIWTGIDSVQLSSDFVD